jgi:hypothetical protein
LTIDPQLAEGSVVKGMVRLFHDWDRDGSERDFRRALDLNPRLPVAQLRHGCGPGLKAPEVWRSVRDEVRSWLISAD